MNDKTAIGYENNDLRRWFPNARVIIGPTITPSLSDSFGFQSKDRKQYNKDCINTLLEQGNGARGNLMVVWNECASGHSISYEISDGKCLLRDAQANYIYKKPEEFFSMTRSMFYARLDNIEFDPKRIKEAVN